MGECTRGCGETMSLVHHHLLQQVKNDNPCARCDGSGDDPETSMVSLAMPCGKCGGRGTDPDMEHMEDRFYVELRCGNCGAERVDVFPRYECAVFEADTDTHHEQMLDDLKQLGLVMIEANLESFVRALNEDIITADDFAVPREPAHNRNT